jgi:hypothetical protein
MSGRTHIQKKQTSQSQLKKGGSSTNQFSSQSPTQFSNSGSAAQQAEERTPTQFQVAENTESKMPLQKKEDNTGLPSQLKEGLKNLSGMDLSDVKVHYNSEKPAQMRALAYAQGNDIHVGPGQEKHLPHEGWHVVQQKQGRVQPTVQRKDGALINDDKGLEHEADVMGARANQIGAGKPIQKKEQRLPKQLIQRKGIHQFTYLQSSDPAPADGLDPEAPEIEWWRRNPYILDDHNEWRRVSRELVNNQRGERGNDHNIDADILREGVRKTYRRAATKLYRIRDENLYVKIVFNYGMVITAYYMNESAAKRDELGVGATDTAWQIRKDQMATLG